MLVKIIAVSSTVALLVWMGFFMMGSLPLLILKHETPLDAGFIRGLFNVYYLAVMATAAVGALGYALYNRLEISVAMAGIAVLGFLLHRQIVGRMDAVRPAIMAHDASAVSRFRRLHVGGMLLNLLQLAIFCVGMTKIDFI